MLETGCRVPVAAALYDTRTSLSDLRERDLSLQMLWTFVFWEVADRAFDWNDEK
jgi:hypothetical protein